MTTTLNSFWVPHHRRPDDYNYIKAMNPAIVKIQDGGDIDYKWVRENVPNALVVARDWAIGEQHYDMAHDPVGTGKAHAKFWADNQARLGFIPANTICLGINEPKIWENMQVVPYTIAFLDELKRLGLRGGALQLSVGWPNNTGPDTVPDWSIFPGVEAAINRGNHVLVTHEYWADGGPADHWKWWAGRILSCPWNVPIVIGECGFEMAVKKAVDDDHRGWRGNNVSADAYADMLIEYCNRLKDDSRVIAVAVFASDFANEEWWTVDVQPAYSQILAKKQFLKPKSTTPWVPPTTTPPVVVPPVVVPPVVTPVKTVFREPLDEVIYTQFYGQNPENYVVYGLRGHNGTDYHCESGTPIYAISDGIVAYVGTDKNYGIYLRIWNKAGMFHHFYAHLSVTNVKLGDAIKIGQLIAKSGATGVNGNTGLPNPAHLHLEIRQCDERGTYVPVPEMANGAVDPISFMAGVNRGAALGGGSTTFLPFVSR